MRTELQPQELRIGNIYNRKHGKGWTETTIDEKLMSQIFDDNDPLLALNDFEPIPLSEEWLKKFGFKKTAQNIFKLVLPSHSSFEEYVIASIGSVRIQICKNGAYAYDPIIQYVHQLQNLYFALTGTELNLKQ